MSWWLFSPRIQEVQFDEKWAFVGKKPCHCDPEDSEDDHKGGYWDNVAFDPQHRLVLAVVPGARSIENAEAIVDEVQRRVDPEVSRLLTSDEYPAYESAIAQTFGVPLPTPSGPGRPRIVPRRVVPEDLTYAEVHKHREVQRVIAVDQRLVFGTARALD